MRRLFVFFLFVIFGLLFGCSTTKKIDLITPEPDNAEPLIYPISTSFISFPIHIPLQEMEDQTNKILVDLIYEDSNINDDDTEMKVWKSAPLKITKLDSKLKFDIPLKIWAKLRYGTNVLGVSLYDTKEFNLEGTITFLSDVKFSNWKISTNTKIENLDWTKSPSIVISGKSIPITYIINPTLKIFKNKIENKLDSSLDKVLDFKTNVLEMMEKVSKPFEMNSDFQTWLKITPKAIYSTEAVLSNNSINMDIGIKCLMQSYIGHKPTATFKKEEVLLKSVSSLTNDVSLTIAAVSNFKDASRVMTNNFKGIEFVSGKKKIKILNVEIWHKKGKMIIALDLSGSLNGRIYLSGFPVYNSQTKELFFDDLDYLLETKSKLLKTANWLAHDMILNKIRKNCRYSLQPNFNMGRENILKYISNYSPIQGVFINGKLEDISFDKLQLTNHSIIAFLKIKGDINVKINGLK